MTRSASVELAVSSPAPGVAGLVLRCASVLGCCWGKGLGGRRGEKGKFTKNIENVDQNTRVLWKLCHECQKESKPNIHSSCTKVGLCGRDSFFLGQLLASFAGWQRPSLGGSNAVVTNLTDESSFDLSPLQSNGNVWQTVAVPYVCQT